MKTGKFLTFALLNLLTAGVILTSCQKDDKDVKGSNDPSTMTNLNDDEGRVEEAMDESLKDAEGVMSNVNGNLKNRWVPCNATLDSTAVTNDTITYFITYNGLSCDGNRNRTGQVEIKKHVDTHFGDQGATLKIRHINFTITKTGTNHTIILNGSKTLTNVSGGYLFMLGMHNGLDKIIHRVTGNNEVTFASGTSRSWNIARQRTFTGEPDHMVVTVEGLGSADTYNNLVTWGLNRNDEKFYTQISQPVIYKENCEWHPVSGIKIHSLPEAEKNAIVTFGYIENQPITGDQCPTHFKVDWVNGTFSGTQFFPLP